MTTPATALNDAFAYLLTQPAGHRHTIPVSCTKSQPDFAAWCLAHGLEIVRMEQNSVTLRRSKTQVLDSNAP